MKSPKDASTNVYEHQSEPLLSRRAFAARFLRHFGAALGIILGCLSLGAAGYHLTEDLPWLDAILNAAMILTGMGPVDHVRTVGGKLFATVYALFSGVAFLGIAGLLVAPVAHRLLHKLHLDDDDTPQIP